MIGLRAEDRKHFLGAGAAWRARTGDFGGANQLGQYLWIQNYDTLSGQSRQYPLRLKGRPAFAGRNGPDPHPRGQARIDRDRPTQAGRHKTVLSAPLFNAICVLHAAISRRDCGALRFDRNCCPIHTPAGSEGGPGADGRTWIAIQPTIQRGSASDRRGVCPWGCAPDRRPA